MRPRKRSFAIRGHRTSISLEPPFWDALREIAAARRVSLAALVAEIDAARGEATGLSTAVRLHVLQTLRTALAAARGAGSGSHPTGPGATDDDATRADDPQ